MPFRRKYDPFTVSVEAAFAEDGVWLIDARLKFRDGPPQLGSDLLGEGRIALLQAIAREAERGRVLGANKVRVHMDGHEGVGVAPELETGWLQGGRHAKTLLSTCVAAM